jgi:hypothetical protein
VWHQEKSVFDWLNLPVGAREELLWDSLHDAQLSSLRSDLFERTVTATFSNFSFLEFHKLPADLHIALRLEGVQAARVVSWDIWPGQKPDHTGISYDESTRLSAEYRAKWREKSVSWSEFERRIANEQKAPIVLDAELSRHEGLGIALRLAVMTQDDDYFEITFRASALTLCRSDGETIDLETLKTLGATYWNDWGKDRKQ